MKAALAKLGAWAKSLKRDIIALHIASQDPRTPRAAKLLAACVLAYALSPIDLVPDFIPVLGQLDDLMLVPLGLWLAIRWIPHNVMEEARRQSDNDHRLAKRLSGVWLVLFLWVIGALALTLLAMRWLA